MKAKIYAMFVLQFLISMAPAAATFEGKIEDWKGPSGEKFTDPETNFKLVLKKIRENYIERDLTDEELYRAAAAGVLASLNSGNENENWNVLFSPKMLRNFTIEKTGRLTGIGVALEFDPKTGYAKILSVIPDSAALKAGIKKDDQILSVNGKSYKGLTLEDVSFAIRGPAGEAVRLKVLREDQILNLKIARTAIRLPEVNATMMDSHTALLTIGFFKDGTAKEVERQLARLATASVSKLIVDLRGNSGGTFSDAIRVAELLVPKGNVITRTRSRGGEAQEHKSSGNPWRPEARVLILTDQNTSSGAELLTAALKNGRHATMIGGTTRGKWNVQTIEELPNKFAMKFTVSTFEAPDGRSYGGTGMKPDLEIESPKGPALGETQRETDPTKRLRQDAPLKAAVEFSPAAG